VAPIADSKKNHQWRKTIWQTDQDQYPLGPTHSVEVYCCEESNGYAIWYVRRLGKDDARGVAGTENADYLLKFYAKSARDAAIEHAVLIANSDPSVEKVIEKLDTLAAAGAKV
jgi:hypothetical protein